MQSTGLTFIAQEAGQTSAYSHPILTSTAGAWIAINIEATKACG